MGGIHSNIDFLNTHFLENAIEHLVKDIVLQIDIDRDVAEGIVLVHNLIPVFIDSEDVHTNGYRGPHSRLDVCIFELLEIFSDGRAVAVNQSIMVVIGQRPHGVLKDIRQNSCITALSHAVGIENQRIRQIAQLMIAQGIEHRISEIGKIYSIGRVIVLIKAIVNAQMTECGIQGRLQARSKGCFLLCVGVKLFDIVVRIVFTRTGKNNAKAIKESNLIFSSF